MLSLAFATVFVAFVTGSALFGNIPLMVLGVYLGTSLLAFAAYAVDKSAARKEQWRTKVSTLLVLGIIGGWPGALVAQRVLHHKSRKQPFQALFWVTVMANCSALLLLLAP